MHYPVVVFGIKDITAKFVETLCAHGQHVDCVVTIDEKIPQEAVISSYGSMDALEALGVAVFKTDAYTLDSEKARNFFTQNTFGVGFSMNWSRLIPGWIIERFDAGIFGLHGSSGYLPFGQGRATLNWAIIRGDTRFIMHLFRMDAGVDSPNIYARTAFEVNPYDTIRTLQWKDLLASEQLAMQLLRDYRAGLPLETHLQQSDPQYTYPGRKPEDGRLDVLARAREICALVRAVTHPFPGAFAFCRGEKVMVWQAQPFDGVLDFCAYRPGEVIDVLDGHLLVRAVDGSYLITEYEAAAPLVPGDVFT